MMATEVHAPERVKHIVEIGLMDWRCLRHPDGEDRARCTIEAVMEALRLDNGQMQVQGLYAEKRDGTFERL